MHKDVKESYILHCKTSARRWKTKGRESGVGRTLMPVSGSTVVKHKDIDQIAHDGH